MPFEEPRKMNPCIVPCAPQDGEDGRWLSQHNQHLTETKGREPDVVMIGDSIIHHLQLRPVWSDMFEQFHCLNFGISGDKTQNVLWRIQHGELDNITPKAVVIHVGTNNIDDTAQDVVDGIMEVAFSVRTRLPEAYLIILELLPRGQYPNKLREKNKQVNQLLRQKVQGLPRIEALSVENGLVQSDGTISHLDMPDYLHLSDLAYRKAFEPLHDLLSQILYEDEKEKELSFSE
ncbi:platelet-activating factor acetylhydrolase IB subunit beta homolog [Cimex lectularius]|uniref:SGNH hydrolase-type esterase domain-containing protein n=1 Tax=Cimex lectularius TaxID=79782 RepID=A0A8I6SCS7_CIMLE|nr:platelet-activating factor acetylhydrolase IB subunit beta homolog [Cimex lectularius]